MTPSMHLPAGYKRISLNTVYGSLEHPALNGYVFNITDRAGNGHESAKKFIHILGPSNIVYERVEGFEQRIAYVNTYSEVVGFDVGMPPSSNRRIFIGKDNIYANNSDGGNLPTILFCDLVQQTEQYGNHFFIDGPSSIIYDPDNYHEFGGKVRIETAANVILQKDGIPS
jgi:hypothetical protein